MSPFLFGENMRGKIITTWHRYSEIFYISSALASIVGLSFIGINDPYRANIALFLICLMFFVLFLRTWQVVGRVLQGEFPSEYLTDSLFINYSTDDGDCIKYEVYKYIQCKRISLAEYAHGFHWTGSKEPKITSELQELKEIRKSEDGVFDRAMLRLKQPLKYNDCETIHVAMMIDDSDHHSETYLENSINKPLKLLKMQVELHNKPDGYKGVAKCKRKKMSERVNHGYELLEDVKFNPHSKSFKVVIPKPEIGYFYRLEWDR